MYPKDNINSLRNKTSNNCLVTLAECKWYENFIIGIWLSYLHGQWRQHVAIYVDCIKAGIYNCLAHVPSECLTKLKVFQLFKFVLCVVKRPANLYAIPFDAGVHRTSKQDVLFQCQFTTCRCRKLNPLYLSTHSFLPLAQKDFCSATIFCTSITTSILCPILWMHCWLKVHECAMKREPKKIDTLTCLVYGWVRFRVPAGPRVCLILVYFSKNS